MNLFYNFLNAETTQQNILNEIADDPSKAGHVISQWWQELNLIDKVIEKIPTIVIAVIFFIIGFTVAKFAGKLVVKALRKNVLTHLYTTL